MEMKEDWGQGGGSHPVKQLLAYYSQLVAEQLLKSSPAAKFTCMPALGLEVYGNSFR
jgi:hypothetical protein